VSRWLPSSLLAGIAFWPDDTLVELEYMDAPARVAGAEDLLVGDTKEQVRTRLRPPA
jgi:hypothetical protein